MKSKISAFSLLEMTLVLLLVAAFVVLGAKPAKQTYAGLQEKIFLKRFDSQWNHAIQTACNRNDHVKVIFEEGRVRFIYGGQRQDESYALSYPATISHQRGAMIKITPAGNVTPQIVTLNSALKKKGYTFRFQLGYGGKYVLEK